MNNPYRAILIAGTILATVLAAESCHAFKTGTAADTIDNTRRALAGADLSDDTSAAASVTAILQVIHPCATI